MMDLDKLDWILYKQRDIVNQIITIKQRIKDGKPIRNIGIPDSIDAQSLINFQKDRYHILEIAKNYDEERIQKWIHDIRQRLLRSPSDYTALSELELLEGCIKGWLKLVEK